MLIYLQMIETPEDRTKFEQIYDKYLGLMYHVALKILGNHEDAEDAVHQSFISIAENIKTIHDVDCPETKSYLMFFGLSQICDVSRSLLKTANASACFFKSLFTSLRVQIIILYWYGFSICGRYCAGADFWCMDRRRSWSVFDPAGRTRQGSVAHSLSARFAAGGGQSNLSQGGRQIRWASRTVGADGYYNRRRGFRHLGDAVQSLSGVHEESCAKN